MTNGGAVSDGEEASRIKERYWLFGRIPVFVDAAGAVYADDLWARDLARHIAHIAHFNLCCPVMRGAQAPEGWRPLVGLTAENIIALRAERGWSGVIACALPNFFACLRAAKRAELVHSEAAGWPFPLSYYLLALRPFLRFRWIVNMESSFWLAPSEPGSRPTLRQRIGRHFHLFMVRACMRAADARLFTQAWYRDLILGENARRSLVNEAVWVDAADLLSDAAFADRRERRRDEPVRLLFPSRLVREKGVATVLGAIAKIEALQAGDAMEGPILIIDIMGSGVMEDEVRAFVAGHVGRVVALSFLAPVPYGAPFFAHLGRYDAFIVANLAEEQPRILYDGFSQGVPAVASRTTGVTQVARDGETAILFAPGSDTELADQLLQLTKPGARERLSAMGATALALARGRTHDTMHRTRVRFLTECLGLAT